MAFIELFFLSPVVFYSATFLYVIVCIVCRFYFMQKNIFQHILTAKKKFVTQLNLKNNVDEDDDDDDNN